LLARSAGQLGRPSREADFKIGRASRSRWLSRSWRTSPSGNNFLNTQDGFNVVVAYRCGEVRGAG